MKKRSLLSLLLVLALVFSLAGCGSSEAGSNKGKDEKETKSEYEVILTSLERFVKDKDDIDAMCGFIGGEYFKDEFRKLLDMELEYGLIDLDSLVSEMEKYLNANSEVQFGSEIQATVTDEEDLGEEEIADYQEQLDTAYETLSNATETFSSLQDQVLDAMDEYTDEQKAQVDAQLQSQIGMTLDEYLELLESYVDMLSTLADKLENAKVDTVRKVSVEYTGDDIDSESEELIFIKIDGEWTTSALIDSLNLLEALNSISF